MLSIAFDQTGSIVTEIEYIVALETQWPQGPPASREVLSLASLAVRDFPDSARLWFLRGQLLQMRPDDYIFSGLDAACSFERALELDPALAAKQPSLFPDDVSLQDSKAKSVAGSNLRPSSFDRQTIRDQVKELASKGVYIGTSSWKYGGWLGQLYTPSRYEHRGKVARSRFERECLTEYAEVFNTVCVDAAYYSFPRPEYLQGLADQVPDDFQFGFKVTDEITAKRFPNLERFGARAGQLNSNFLNADLFTTAFLQPCESIREQVGVLMFEFSCFHPRDYQHGCDFVADLETFLGQLPKGWPYAVELRNRHWLRDEYFACLTRQGVTHVFNSWEAMPAVSEQMTLPGSRTNPELIAARFLLKPGRHYEEAVKTFQPYDRVHEVNEDARKAAAGLIVEGERYEPRRKTFIYVNNRLEGNSLETIAAILSAS
jgi:uncharacterized protein YecE (DUF72 family)